MKNVPFNSNDYALAALVFVLWSVGRIILPVLRTSVKTMGEPSTVLVSATTLYIVLHALVFSFALWLFVAKLPKLFKQGIRETAWWQPALYLYVLVATVASLYLIAYEFEFYISGIW